MMITRRKVGGLVAGLAAATAPRLARAAHLPDVLDIIPVAVRGDLAINYNVADWTNIAWVAGQTCFTCHTQTLRGGPYQQMQDGIIRVCLGGPGQVRLVSFYWDANGPVYDRSWAPPFVCRPQYSLDNQGASIADHFNQTIGSTTGMQHIFTMEVNGVGSVYMARLEINWNTGQ